MIHWIAFNLMVLLVSLSLVFDFRNDAAIVVGWILVIVTIILIIKDFFAIRG